MPIMLGGGNSEKLSRLYKGDELLVGGMCGYEGYIDVRGKTQQQIEAEGRGVSCKNTTSIILDSSGLGYSGSTNVSAWIYYQLPENILTNNCILEIEMTGYCNSTATYAGGVSCRLENTSVVDNTQVSGQKWIGGWNSGGSVNPDSIGYDSGYYWQSSSTIGSGDSSHIFKIDFKNKKTYYSKTSPGTAVSGEATLTDSQISEILTFRYIIGHCVGYGSGGSGNKVKTVRFKVTY